MNRIGVEKPSLLGMPQRDPGGRRPRTRHPGTPSRGPRPSQGSRRRATKFRQPPILALSGCQLLPYRVRTRIPRNPEARTRKTRPGLRSRSHILSAPGYLRTVPGGVELGRASSQLPRRPVASCSLERTINTRREIRNPRRQPARSRVTSGGRIAPGSGESCLGGDDASLESRLYTVRVTRPPRAAP